MREKPAGFGTEKGLFGLTCDPGRDADPERPAFVFLNAGTLSRVGPSRLHVRLARRLASEGFRSLRFDFSGIGDSERPRDARPYLERSVAETCQAMDYMEDAGARTFVLAGLCSGAEVAHAAAVEDDRVAGIIPMDGHLYPTPRYYFHRYAPRLVNARSWMNILTGRNRVISSLKGLITGEAADDDSPDAVAVFRKSRPPREQVAPELQALADRGVRMLHVYSGELEMLCTYEGQFWSAFNEVDFRGLAEVEYLAESDHTVTDLEDQRRLVERIVQWAQAGWPEGSGDGLSEPATESHVVDHVISVGD